MTKITKHAEKRLKERSGISQKAADRIMDSVWQKGLSHADLRGNLRKWVDSKRFWERNVDQIRLYGDKLYLFSEEKLVTVIQIPQDLAKEVSKQRKKRLPVTEPAAEKEKGL